MEVQNDFHNKYSPPIESKQTETINKNILESYVTKLQSEEISNIYPSGEYAPDKLELNNNKVLKRNSNEENDPDSKENEM